MTKHDSSDSQHAVEPLSEPVPQRAKLATHTAGAIVGASLSEQLRSHRDIASGKDGGKRKRVKAFYGRLAARAAERGHAIDVISASLEEIGLYEMGSCVRRSCSSTIEASAKKEASMQPRYAAPLGARRLR